MIKALNKIIKLLVIPKFPNVIDFEVTSSNYFDHTYYSVIYYVKKNRIDLENFSRLEKLTENVFKVMGVELWKFTGISFETK